MKLHQMKKIFTDTAYIRTGGSPEELRCAEYLRDRCTDLGLNAWLENFEVDMATMEEAQLLIDGKATSTQAATTWKHRCTTWAAPTATVSASAGGKSS